MEKELILDYSKWRCGGDGKNELGKGNTRLLNNKGCMCCLGQFSLQLNKNITLEKLSDKHVPAQIGYSIPLLTRFKNGQYFDTKLSIDAININDNRYTTPEQKIELLKELFSEHGYNIKVINKPE